MIVKVIIPLIVLFLLGGFFLYQKFWQEESTIIQPPTTESQPIKPLSEPLATKPRAIETPAAETQPSAQKTPPIAVEPRSERPILITNGVKHTIPLDEIRGGGPPKDGIPSIDNPKFVSMEEASEWLSDNEPGIVFSRGDIHRFYPYQILVWHEIVNDTVGDERILVTYCPLCLTGYIFDPLVKGERVEFGTSGKLWKSNLVMYDRKTDSLWSQILGEAVVGEMAGAKLNLLPSDQIRFEAFRKNYPKGEVLSRDTGAIRFYGENPYGDYFSVTNLSLFLAKPKDTRLPNDALVLGITINGKPKAYSVDAIKQKGEVTDVFEGETLVVRYEKDIDAVRIYKQGPDGLTRINPFSAFWFSWATAHPDTEVFKKGA